MGEASNDVTPVRVFNVLRGDALDVRATPFGDVGTVFTGAGIECVWVSKLQERIDPDWFSSQQVDLIVVIQGQLRFEFESSDIAGRVLSPGDVLVLRPNVRCRAYRWPRDGGDAAVFVAVYPTADRPDDPGRGRSDR